LTNPRTKNSKRASNASGFSNLLLLDEKSGLKPDLRPIRLSDVCEVAQIRAGA
jgi:hypothetical protein